MTCSQVFPLLLAVFLPPFYVIASAASMPLSRSLIRSCLTSLPLLSGTHKAGQFGCLQRAGSLQGWWLSRGGGGEWWWQQSGGGDVPPWAGWGHASPTAAPPDRQADLPKGAPVGSQGQVSLRPPKRSSLLKPESSFPQAWHLAWVVTWGPVQGQDVLGLGMSLSWSAQCWSWGVRVLAWHKEALTWLSSQ